LEAKNWKLETKNQKQNTEPGAHSSAMLLSVRLSVPPTSTPFSSRRIICPRPKPEVC
jgi:hypothetical protein